MRKKDSKLLVYESLLYLYYDESAKFLLAPKTREVVGSFVKFCKKKDIIDNTKTAETMEVIYNPKNMMTKGELKHVLALSGSSFYRFRIKLVRDLYKYIYHNIGEKI